MERAIQLRRRDLPFFGRQSANSHTSLGYELNNSINIDKFTMFFDKLTGVFCSYKRRNERVNRYENML